MMKIGQAPLALGAALAGMLALPVAAVADERVCVGAIGPETVDNVVVPAGATCTLNGTFAKGTVKVERGATLQAQSVRVIGNVQGEGATLVAVRSSSVGGSVQVKQGGAAETTGSQVTGDIQYDQESGPLRVADNDVNGSVQVMQNRGGVLIATNTIDGNLQCKENEPPPNGGGNLVHGNAEDQCAALAGGPGASAPSAGVERAVTLDHVRTRGTRAVFRGQVAGAGSGVKVVLQRRSGGRWHSVVSDRTNRRGVYRFSRGFRTRTVRVRVLVRRQAGWPSRTASAALQVRFAG